MNCFNCKKDSEKLTVITNNKNMQKSLLRYMTIKEKDLNKEEFEFCPVCLKDFRIFNVQRKRV